MYIILSFISKKKVIYQERKIKYPKFVFFTQLPKEQINELSRSRIQSFLLSSFERIFKNLKSFALPCINFSAIWIFQARLVKALLKPLHVSLHQKVVVAQLLLIFLITRRHMKQKLWRAQNYTRRFTSLSNNYIS